MDEHLEAMYEDANGSDLDTAWDAHEVYWDDDDMLACA